MSFSTLTPLQHSGARHPCVPIQNVTSGAFSHVNRAFMPIAGCFSSSSAFCSRHRDVDAHITAQRPQTRGAQQRVPSCNAYAGRPSQSSSADVVAFSQGPHRPFDLPPISFTAGQAASGPLTCQIQVTVPSGQSCCPVVLLSAGFLLHSSLYRSYAADLASHGFVVVRYDVPEVVDDLVMVDTMGSILSLCASDSRVSPYVDPSAMLLAGHSRGGKLSALLASTDPRVKGLALIDPVDVTQMTPKGPGYPSALPALRTASSAPRKVPVLVIGAAMNGAVIPAEGNYKRFTSSCAGLSWSVELQGAGHLQFLDEQVGLFSMFSTSGPTPDSAVRAVTKGALLKWAQAVALPLARGQGLDGRQVQSALEAEARTLRDIAPLDSMIRGLESYGGSTTASSTSSGSSTSGPGYDTGASGQRTSSYSSSSASGSAAGSSGSRSSSSSGSVFPRVNATYEQLMEKRAKELKAMLVERGIDCSDCYEKEELAKRIIQRCA